MSGLQIEVLLARVLHVQVVCDPRLGADVCPVFGGHAAATSNVLGALQVVHLCVAPAGRQLMRFLRLQPHTDYDVHESHQNSKMTGAMTRHSCRAASPPFDLQRGHQQAGCLVVAYVSLLVHT